MRVAVSGTHAAGKSTLVAELARHLPGYVAVEEPYYTLLDEGHLFADEPAPDDFELLLDRSITALATAAGADMLFDRCPADYLGYLAALSDHDAGTLAPWITRAADAMAGLDLVVFVPIERLDRIDVEDEQRRLRKRVHQELHAMLVDDAWGIGAPVLEVGGTVEQRVRQVLARVGG
ncbi:MAG TPA: ATP-binding protein [Longimicrobium sp.]|jgi:predicted ATPase